jgi:hypothetical protein
VGWEIAHNAIGIPRNETMLIAGWLFFPDVMGWSQGQRDSEFGLPHNYFE